MDNQYLVIRLSVTGKNFVPFAIKSLKIFTTEPLDLKIFPYLTTANLVFILPATLFPAMN